MRIEKIEKSEDWKRSKGCEREQILMRSIYRERIGRVEEDEVGSWYIRGRDRDVGARSYVEFTRGGFLLV